MFPKLIIFTSFFFLLIGCKKEVNQGKTPDIYVAGKMYVDGAKASAVYWKNGQLMVLDSGSYAKAICVNGSDVIVAGGGNNGNRQIAKYWINSIPYNLTDGSKDAEVNSLCNSGSDVFIAGKNGSYATYWKNGSEVALTDGTKNASALSIFVSGKDIYVTGYEGNKAKYWKNGWSGYNLSPDSVSRSWAYAICASGNDIYIALVEESATGVSSLILWKNGIRKVLGTSTHGAYVGSISITNNDVYVCGDIADAVGYKARYWKNGIETVISDPQGNDGANGMCIFRNDVYVVGVDYTRSTCVAKYWKNGTEHKLVTENKSSWGYGIFVTE
jgi:hypothetical protein